MRCKAAWQRRFKLPWREAGPSNHLDKEVDSVQYIVNKQLARTSQRRVRIEKKVAKASPAVGVTMSRPHRGGEFTSSISSCNEGLE